MEENMDDTLGDWRIQGIARVTQDIPAAYPGGPSHKAGTPIYLSTSTRGTGNQPIGFTTPSSTALALNTAINASTESNRLFKLIIFEEVITPEGPGRAIFPKNAGPLFDYFESCMISITFSFQALETFCNWEIADKVKGTITVKRSKGDEDLIADELERKLSTEEKLHLILPSLFGTASPKGRKVWENFKKLKHARDSIVHIKASDQYPNRSNLETVDQDSLYFVFLNNKMTDFSKAAIELIRYFYNAPNKVPRWLQKSMELARQS
jgi:hypothetical protein